jgi:hypothetical protein
VVADALSCKNKATMGRLTVGKDRQLVELKEIVADLSIIAGGRLVAQYWCDQRIGNKYYMPNSVTRRGPRLGRIWRSE